MMLFRSRSTRPSAAPPRHVLANNNTEQPAIDRSGTIIQVINDPSSVQSLTEILNILLPTKVGRPSFKNDTNLHQAIDGRNHFLFYLPTNIRKKIYGYCFQEETRPITLSRSWVTKNIFPPGHFASIFDIQEHAQGALMSCKELRQQLLMYFYSSYKFHVTVSVFTGPKLSYVHQTWPVNIIQRLTVEVDFTGIYTVVIESKEILQSKFDALINGLQAQRPTGLKMAELVITNRRVSTPPNAASMTEDDLTHWRYCYPNLLCWWLTYPIIVLRGQVQALYMQSYNKYETDNILTNSSPLSPASPPDMSRIIRLAPGLRARVYEANRMPQDAVMQGSHRPKVDEKDPPSSYPPAYAQNPLRPRHPLETHYLLRLCKEHSQSKEHSSCLPDDPAVKRGLATFFQDIENGNDAEVKAEKHSTLRVSAEGSVSNADAGLLLDNSASFSPELSSAAAAAEDAPLLKHEPDGPSTALTSTVPRRTPSMTRKISGWVGSIGSGRRKKYEGI